MKPFTPVLTPRPCSRCLGTGRQFDQAATGAALRAIRLENGHTLRSVAGAMGMTFQTISELEKGRWAWRQELVKGYLKACGAEVPAFTTAPARRRKRAVKETIKPLQP